jgi:hypothetical protein
MSDMRGAKRCALLRLWLLLLGAGIAAIISPSAPQSAQAEADCVFQLGFKTLRDLIPDKVGDCQENERTNPVNGDSEQITTGGLLVWRKADNWTAFTDGATTWINGPQGLSSRPSSGPPFSWEAAARMRPTSTEAGAVSRSAGAAGLSTVLQAVERSSPHAQMILGVVLFILMVVAFGTERGLIRVCGVVIGPLVLFIGGILIASSPANSLVTTLLLAFMSVVCVGVFVWTYVKGGFGITKRAVFSLLRPRRPRRYLTQGYSGASGNPLMLQEMLRRFGGKSRR